MPDYDDDRPSDGKILDGRNRYRACEVVGVEPKFVAYKGNDPLSFVVSANLKRRHLSADQRAVIAAKIANLENGQRADLAAVSSANLQSVAPVSRATAAGMMNVSERSVNSAASVRKSESAAPELKQAMEAGSVAPSFAEKVAKWRRASEPIYDLLQICRRSASQTAGRLWLLRSLGPARMYRRAD